MNLMPAGHTISPSNGKPGQTDIFGTFIFVLLIFSSGGIRFFPVFILNLVILAFLSVQFLTIINKKENLSIFVKSIVICSLFFTINYLYNKETTTPKLYFVYFLNFINAVLVVIYFKNKNQDQFLNSLYLALRLFMIHALISFAFQWIFLGLSTVYLNKTMTYKTFLYLFYYTHTSFIYYGFINRNTGLFWEPGVLQIFMNILLFISLFIKKERNTALLSGFVVFSTFSTTGLAVLLLQAGAFFFQKRKTFALIPVFLVFAFFFGWVFKENLQEKILGDQSGSFIYRAFHAEMSVNIISSNKWMGIGPTDAQKLGEIIQGTDYFNNLGINSDPKFLIEKVSDDGNANSWLIVAMAFGIPFFCFFYFKIYKQTIFRSQKILFFLIFMISISTEAIIDTSFFLIFFLSAFFQSNKQFEKQDVKSFSSNTLFQPG